MRRKLIFLVVVFMITVFNAGCALIGTVLSAGAAYGIYKATH